MKVHEPTDHRTGQSFMLIFVLLALGIVVAGYIYYRNYKRNYRAGADLELSAIAELKVHELTQYRNERLGDAAILFKNNSLSDLVRRFLEKPEDTDAQRQLLVWLGKYQAHHQYERAFLLDARGVVRIAVPATPVPVDDLISQRVPELLRSGQVALQDFYRNEHDQHVYLALLVPVLDESHAQRPLGAVMLRIDPIIYLYPFIQRWPTASKTAETLLVRREGNQVVYLNDLRLQTNTALNLRLPLDQATLPAAQAALGREGTMEGLDYRGVPVVAALRTIPDSPWALVARMNAAEVYAPLRERLWLTAFFTGVLLICASAGVALLWRRQHIQFYLEQAQAAAALRESEERFSTLVVASTEVVWRADAHGEPIGENLSWRQFTGQSLDDIRNGRWTGAVHPEDRAAMGEVASHAYAERVPYKVENRLRRYDGEWRHMIVRGIPILEADGTVREWVGSCQDITELKEAEAALRESETRLQLSVQASNVGLWDWDLQTNTVHFSPEWKRQIGHRDDEISNRFDEWQSRVHPDDLELTLQKVRAFIENPQGRHEVEFRFRHKDGSYRWIYTQADVLSDAAGKPIRMLGCHIDITDRKNEEAALRETRDLLNETGRIARIGGWKMDLISRKATWTQGTYDIVEIAPGEPIPGPDEHVDYYLPEYRPLVIEAMRGLIEDDKPLDFEAQLRTAKGNVKWCHALGEVLRKGGKAVEVYGTFQDITDRKRDQAALRESEDNLRRAGEIAHVGYWSRDVVSGRIDRSDETCRIFGVEPQATKIDLSTLLDRIHREDRQMVSRAIENAVAGIRPYDLEYRVLRPDGTVRWVHSKGEVGLDSAGQPARLFGIVLDITERKQVEEELQESAKKYRALFEESRDAISITGRNGKFIEGNGALLELFGYTQEELASLNAEATWASADDRSRFQQEIEKKGFVRDYRAKLRKKDGTEMDCLITSTVRQAVDGSVLGYQGIIRDVTERTRAEEALKAERKRLYDVLEAMPIMVCLLTPDYHVAFANRAFREKFGESYGRRCFEYCFGKKEPCDFCETYSVLKTAKPHHWQVKIMDGASVIEVYKLPFTDVDGSPMVLEVNIDVTERERAAVALQESESRYRDLFDSMSSGVAVYEARNHGQDFVFTDFNRAAERIEMVPRDAVLNRSVAELFPGVKEFGLFNVLQRVWRTGQPENYPMRLYRDSRIVGWRENHVYKLPSGEIVAIYNDVTERKLAEEALRRLSLQLSRTQDAERRRIARELHDSTGQRLAALSLTVGLLQDAASAPAGQTDKLFADCLATIEQCAQEIRTVSYLLHPPLLDELGLPAAIGDYVEGFTKRSGLQITLDMPPDLERLPEEVELALFRIVQESLGNIHSHAGASAARIYIACDAEQVTLEISDDGHGMSAETKRAIEADRGSSGVGIAGMQERLRLLGGRLEIESGGQGTTARAIIPRPEESS